MSELKYQVVEPMIELYVYDDKVVCYYNGCFKKHKEEIVFPMSSVRGINLQKASMWNEPVGFLFLLKVMAGTISDFLM